MDSSSSVSLPGPGGSSPPPFPLLDAPLGVFLKQILQKMSPSVLATVRQSSFTVDCLLMEEASRRKSVAQAGPDVVEDSEEMSAPLFLTQDTVYLPRSAAPFSSTSLLFHPTVTLPLQRQSYDFWKQHIRTISAATAMSHLAGSKIPEAVAMDMTDDAQALVDLVSPYKIRLDRLHVKNCSRTAVSQLVSHFQPTVLHIDAENSLDLFQQSEEVALEQIDLDKLEHIALATELQYPARLVEHFLSRFQGGQTALKWLNLEFPPSAYPGSLPLLPGMTSTTLKERYENAAEGIDHAWTALLRSDSRHLLLSGGCYTQDGSSVYKLQYLCCSDVEELLGKMFHHSCQPDEVYPWISDFSQNDIRDIFKSHN